MKVGIKLIALLLYLILATNAAPKGNGKAGAGENEGAEAGEVGGEGEAGEAGEQGELGEAGEQGEAGEAGEMGEQEGLAEGGEVGEEGENAVTVKLPTAIVKSQPSTAGTPTNEEPEATNFVTDAATNKQSAGVAGSVLPDVAPYTPDTSTMPLVTSDDFNYLDQNGDGFLDYRELFLGQNNYNPVYLNAAFQISDKNFDGVVDQREFFRHPLSWGRVVAEKQFFAKDISTSGAGATENVTSQPDVTPTAEETYTEQTYTESPAATSPQLPEDNVTTTVPSAEQSTTGLTAVNEQSSVPTDTSTTAHVRVVKANGGPSVAPAKGTTVQTRTLPKVTQGQKEGWSQKPGSQVGKAGYRPLGTGVVSNGGQPTARKEGTVAGSTGGQRGMATGQKDQKINGAGSSGGQPSAVPGSVGSHSQWGRHGQKRGQAGLAGSKGRHVVTVAGKPRGHAMSHGVQHRTTAGTYTTGVQSGISMYPGGKIRGHTVAYGHSQTVPVTTLGKAQGHFRPQYHHALERVQLEKKGTKASEQSEEEEDEESSNEAEDKKNNEKKGKGNVDNESKDTEDNDENDKK